MKKITLWQVKLVPNKISGPFKVVRTFSDFEEADNWLCNYCRENGLPSTDYIIARSEAIDAR